MKRQMNNDDESDASAINILANLPRDVVVHLLKTTHMSIADVFIFCRTNVWTYQLCDDRKVWKEIYTARFGNIALRRRAEALLAANPIGMVFRFEDAGFAASLLFGHPLRIAEAVANDMEDLVECKDEMISTINQICGPPDELDNQNWSRPLGVLQNVFQRMIVYKLLEHGFTIDE